MTRLETGISEKLAQWQRESAIAAMRAIQAGLTAQLVTYPTGLQMMRFAEPFTTFGAAYEVTPELWETFQTIHTNTQNL